MNREALQRLDQVLGDLMDFQRATVDAVCERLVGTRGLQGRVLVGDEVGLGKTLVARGVIATLLAQRLRQRSSRPLRVAYVCSNQALAQENAIKLAVFKDGDANTWTRSLEFGRLAELGIQQEPAPDGVLLELCSLTPATSFSLTQSAGNARERYIILQALLRTPDVLATAELEAFFRDDVTKSWVDAGTYFDKSRGLEPMALAEFASKMGGEPRLDERAIAAAHEFGVSLRSWHTLLRDVARLRGRPSKTLPHLVWSTRTRIREMFVESCAQNLRADLFILDEFQRFSDLLTTGTPQPGVEQGREQPTEQQIIARRVLHEGTNYGTLLLSATPFKALSHLGDEDEGKAHSEQVEELLMYLTRSRLTLVEQYRVAREGLLGQILSLPEGPLLPGSLDRRPKRLVEAILRSFICRTERAGIEPDIERSFHNTAPCPSVPSIAEIAEFVVIDKLAAAINDESAGTVHADIMQFYKAAPWCLSFLGGYNLRDNLEKYREYAKVSTALKNASAAWIPYEKLQGFQFDLTRNAPGSRFRQVLNAAAPSGAEKLLWMPPSMPYYEGSGPYAGQTGFSKTLLFSSLVLAPRALSSLVSYECERRLATAAKSKGRGYFHTDREAIPRAFRFDANSLSPAWSLAYPSRRLSSLPIVDRASTLAELRRQLRGMLDADVRKLVATYGKGRGQRGPTWYTLAPLLLDRLTLEGLAHAEAWNQATMARWDNADVRGKQLERLLALHERPELELGEAPKDLLDYLVDLAIAGPGNCLARSLARTWSVPLDGAPGPCSGMLVHATDAALSFIDKMNRLESQHVLRAVCGRDKPWIALARYGAMGNLQAVTDEYIHMLKSANGTMAESVKAFKTAVASGSVSVTAQTQLPSEASETNPDVRFHCHYAIPLGNQKSTDEKGIRRITNARAAFNSPFWPFMLNSTSIGQEGLDFHWYCRRIVHWSLPSNPIDLEQREGRINRYKSLVVRQRVAEAYAKSLQFSVNSDVWSDLFDRARAEARQSDLVPFWHCALGTAQIERVVPAMPFSADLSRLDEMLKILSLYRLAFGQPRQQELLQNLLKREFSADEIKEIRDALFVDLAPLHFQTA